MFPALINDWLSGAGVSETVREVLPFPQKPRGDLCAQRMIEFKTPEIVYGDEIRYYVLKFINRH